MKSAAAVAWETRGQWEVEEVELDPPKAHEVLVRIVAAGMCHSDEHLLTGDSPAPLPIIGGHEGAGVVEAVGEEVHRVRPGDHVVMSFIPACGWCRWCVRGRGNLCQAATSVIRGRALTDDGYRFHARGRDIGTMCVVGSFSELTVVHEHSLVRVAPDVPLVPAALVTCCVATGWGAARYAAKVAPGDVTVIVGTGGVGINAIQGAADAGARAVVAVDPLEDKQIAARRFGATHVADGFATASQLIATLTNEAGADQVILAMGVPRDEDVSAALHLIARGGTVVVAGIAPHWKSRTELDIGLAELTLREKALVGSVYGSTNPRRDIPLLLDLFMAGRLKLNELVTKEYPLGAINDAATALREGANIRGVILPGMKRPSSSRSERSPTAV